MKNTISLLFVRRLSGSTISRSRPIRTPPRKNRKKQIQNEEIPEFPNESFYQKYKYYIDSMASTAVAVTVIILIQRWFTNPSSTPPAGPPQVSHYSHEKSKI
jgi:hypothetical protein